MKLSKVKELLSQGKRLEIETPDGWVKIKRFIPKGNKLTYNLITECGIILNGVTDNHKIETNSGWKQVKDLGETDLILTIQGYSLFLGISEKTKEEICDIEVDHPNHRFYADGVSVHNCQDNSVLQHLFAYNVFNTGHTVMVGDLTQEIYQFRFSDSRYLTDDSLYKAYDEVETMHLTTNFRSAHPVVKLGNILRGFAKSEIIQEPAKHTRALPKRVFIKEMKSQISEANEIGRHIKKLIKEGAEPRDIAMITRTNRYIKTNVEPVLLELGIPYVIQGSKTKKLTDKSEVLYIIHCLMLMVATPRSQLYLVKQVMTNIQGIGPKTAEKLCDEMGGSIFNLIKSSNPKGKYITELLRFVQGVSLDGLDRADLSSYIIKFMELSKFDIKDKYLQELLQLFNNWAEIYIEETGKPLELIIPEIQTAIDSVDEDTTNAVRLSTTHSTKGLEFDHVIAAGFTYRSAKMAKPTTEELNILYVQISRAVKSLLLVHSDYINYMGREEKGHKNKWLIKLLLHLKS